MTEATGRGDPSVIVACEEAAVPAMDCARLPAMIAGLPATDFGAEATLDGEFWGGPAFSAVNCHHGSNMYGG